MNDSVSTNCQNVQLPVNVDCIVPLIGFCSRRLAWPGEGISNRLGALNDYQLIGSHISLSEGENK